MLKKTVGLILFLLLIIAGEIFWLSQMDLKSQWSSYFESQISEEQLPVLDEVVEQQDDLTESLDISPLQIATLSDVQGDVTLTRQGNIISPLTPFMPLFPEDFIETGEDGRAEIAWTGYGRTIVASNSKLLITAAEVSEDGSGLVSRLKLESGRIWTRLEKLLSAGSSFEVRASNVVATVRGTSFGVGMDQEGRIDVKVAESNVEVARTANATSDEIVGTPVMVGAMQELSMIENDMQMPEPIPMSAEDMEADAFLMDGNEPVPAEYLDADWMAYIETVINSIPADQLPPDFDRNAFMEYLRQMKSQMPNAQ